MSGDVPRIPRPPLEDALLHESADDLYEDAPCGYLSTTPDGAIVKVNRTFLAWSGYERDALLGRRFADLLRVGGQLYYETHVAPLLQMHGRADEIAYDLVCQDGRLLPALVSATLRRDAAGRPVVQRMTIFNATERRRYERELLRARREAEQAATDLRQILAVLPVAVLIVDAAGQGVVANAAARELGGHAEPAGSVPDAESVALALDRLGLRGPDGIPYPAQDQPLQRSLRDGETIRATEACIRQAGSARLVPVLASSAPLCDAEGVRTGAVAVYQDVTALWELERGREEFLSSAAHDLKTPLTSIRGLAQLARRRLARLATGDITPLDAAPRVDQLVEQMEGIEAATARMTRLLDGVSDLARTRLGAGLELDRAPCDLVALVAGVVARFAGQSPHRIALVAEAPTLTVTLDAARIERVVDNLLSNAVKYSPAGGDITVTVGVARADEARADEAPKDEVPEDGADGPAAVLAVRDRGLGIPAADLPHVFERFHRAAGVRGHIAGTGIGLASVAQIVQQHGGSVAVTSREGAGATFTVRLPLTPETAPGVREAREARAGAGDNGARGGAER